jgi:hypothetical protein
MVAMRVAVVLLGLQFGGLVHDVADVVDAVVLAHEAPEHESCPANRPCDDCPPGCPNCHCSAATTPMVPQAAPSLFTELAATRVLPPSDAAEAPAGPERPTLFRPPRA